MGALLKSFTYPRNAFAATSEKSAVKILELLQRVDEGKLLETTPGQIKDEVFNDARLFHAVVGGLPNAPYVTVVGERFRQLAGQSELSAWRWLLTRSMWLYSVPNGSQADANAAANSLSVHYNFFDMIARLTVHFSALKAPENIMYFDELLPVLDEDLNWMLQGHELFQRVLASRAALGVSGSSAHAGLLDQLEPEYSLSRDYMNTVFKKAFGQCGLFVLTGVENRILGIKLDPAAFENRVLAERLRFVLDHPRLFKL